MKKNGWNLKPLAFVPMSVWNRDTVLEEPSAALPCSREPKGPTKTATWLQVLGAPSPSWSKLTRALLTQWEGSCQGPAEPAILTAGMVATFLQSWHLWSSWGSSLQL